MVKNAAIRDENDPRIAKLPAYAREYIRRLNREASDQKALVAKVVGKRVGWGEREDGKAYVQMPGDDGFREVEPGSRVIMPIGDAWVEMRIECGKLLVMASGQISVLPMVSNVVRIDVVSR